MARFCALPKRCSRAGASVPALCELPGRGAAPDSWGTLSTGTPPPRGGTEGRVPRGASDAVPWHQCRWQPAAPSCLPLFPHRGLVTFPMCLLVLHGHGEAEVRMHVCHNLHLGFLRRKGRTAQVPSEAAAPMERANTLPAKPTAGRGLFAAALLPPQPLQGQMSGTPTSHEERTGPCPTPQQLNPCPLPQLFAWGDVSG